MTPVRLSVRGTSTLSSRPERAQVRISVGAQGADREAVVRGTARVHQQVTGEAAEHRASGAASWWGADRVYASSYQEYVKDSDTTVTRFRASAGATVRFVDFEVLSRWVSDLAARDLVTVGGIEWDLTQATRRRLEREARGAAVRDAVERAGDYATALELGAVALSAVYEEGLRPHPGGDGGGSPTTGTAMRMASAGGGESLSLAPGDIDVHGSVTADFDAERPA